MIDLSVVIANYETSDLLSRCLDSVDRAMCFDSTLGVETILVDNGSRDDSVENARSRANPPRIISLVRNRGFAAAVNLGLRIRRGRHVLLLNSDVEIDEELLLRGVQILDQASDAGVLGAALAHPDGRSQRSVHALPSLSSELIPDPLLGFLRPQAARNRTSSTAVAQTALPRRVEAVRGAAFFIRGELLEKVGLLDEAYFFFLEETDYCWRAREAGHHVLYCESLRATHRLGASSKRRAPLATRIEFHRSLYRFLERRCGRLTSSIARLVRILRSGLSLVGLSLVAARNATARRRLAERWGLLLWHLRGCPHEGGLAAALLAEGSRPR
jgi:GT2 family glycosyltransferase